MSDAVGLCLDRRGQTSDARKHVEAENRRASERVGDVASALHSDHGREHGGDGHGSLSVVKSGGQPGSGQFWRTKWGSWLLVLVVATAAIGVFANTMIFDLFVPIKRGEIQLQITSKTGAFGATSSQAVFEQEAGAAVAATNPVVVASSDRQREANSREAVASNSTGSANNNEQNTQLTDAKISEWAPLRVIAFAAIMFALHGVYLGVVAWDQVFQRHVYEREWQSAVLLILVALAYLVPIGVYVSHLYGALELNTVGKIAKITSLIMFFCVYTAWGVFDLIHLKHLKADGQSDHRTSNAVVTQKRVWMFLDLSLAMVLAAAVVSYFADGWITKSAGLSGGKALLEFRWYEHFSVKELAVAVTIAAYFMLRRVIKGSAESGEILSHKLWQDAIFPDKHVSTEQQSSPSALSKEAFFFTDHKLDLDGLVKSPSAGKKFRILTVNCGTGRRSLQLVSSLHLGGKPLCEPNHARVPADSERVELFGYNHDGRIEGAGEVKHDHFTADEKIAIEWAKVADIIIVLHSTYDKDETNRVSRVLKDVSNRECLILVRGFGDHTFLATVCYQLIDRGFVDVPHYHEWNERHLRDLASACAWQCLDIVNRQPYADGSIKPTAVVKQHFRLNKFSITAMHDYLARHFDPVHADRVLYQLQQVSASTLGTKCEHSARVRADDFVYAFWASKLSPDQQRRWKDAGYSTGTIPAQQSNLLNHPREPGTAAVHLEIANDPAI